MSLRANKSILIVIVVVIVITAMVVIMLQSSATMQARKGGVGREVEGAPLYHI